MSLVIEPSPSSPVWRVGYKPEPLAWAGWEHATDGRFPGRWDDPNGEYRTLYLGGSLLACLLEVLAFARRDDYLANELAEIVEEDDDAQNHPTLEPGTLDRAWLGPRVAAKAVLSGRYCTVTASGTIAELRPHFIGQALAEGHQDFDAALLKNGGARTITQAVSAHLYIRANVDGIRFTSRHGDELHLWCVFEQGDAHRISPHLVRLEEVELQPSTPELEAAFELFKLGWAD